MKILAIDQGTKTGWAFSAKDEPTQYAHVHFPAAKDTHGRLFYAFREWLRALIAKLQPDLLVFESPVLPGGTSIQALRVQYGLAAVADSLAVELGLEVHEVDAPKVRKHFLGKIPKGKGTIKPAIMAMCRAHGLEPKNDHEGDALAILAYATYYSSTYSAKPDSQHI